MRYPRMNKHWSRVPERGSAGPLLHIAGWHSLHEWDIEASALTAVVSDNDSCPPFELDDELSNAATLHVEHLTTPVTSVRLLFSNVRSRVFSAYLNQVCILSRQFKNLCSCGASIEMAPCGATATAPLWDEHANCHLAPASSRTRWALKPKCQLLVHTL
jgi:hypothetical protein